jgi:hypothetical protein
MIRYDARTKAWVWRHRAKEDLFDTLTAALEAAGP